MSGPEGVIPTHSGAALECGCAAEIVEDEIHIRPCSPEHEPTLTEAARVLCAARGIPFEER